MSYTPSTLTIDDWSVPLSIAGTDAIASLDNTVNAIIDTDSSSAKVHINTELAKLPTYLSTELTAIYHALGDDIDVLTGITATADELNIMDGATLTTAELNILDGVTSTYSELNILDGVTSTTAELNALDGITSTVTELNILDGVTSTTAELNILDGVTATATELNLLDGVTATTVEINYTDGVTSAIQTQIDTKLENTVEDTTPQLGGDLDLNGHAIPLALNAQTGTTYTGVLGDAEKIITLNNAAAITMTIPANASVAYSVGTKLNFMQTGAGQVTVAITSDTLSKDALLTLKLNGQYAVATAVKIASTQWVLFGNLELA